jgi:hypothetical protein
MTVLVASSQSQQPARDAASAPPTGTAVISGTVLLGPAGTEPSRRTRVTLNTSDRGITGRTTTTDDMGRFAFRDVPAGRFALQAVRPGYLSASYGSRRPGRPGTAIPVTDGAKVTNLTLRLAKGGVITGTVVDGNGQPAAGISVGVLRYTYRELTGELSLSTETIASTATTDDRGIYRAWGLPPGNYIVMATPQVGGGRGAMASDFQQLTTNDVSRAIAAAKARAAGAAPAPAPPAPRVNYAPVFFPGTPDVSQATTVILKEAEERGGIDVAVRLFRTARIEGTVRTGDGSPLPQPLPVTLLPGGPQGDLLGTRAAGRIKTVNADATGKFLMSDVTPGRYAVVVNTGRVIGGRGGTPMTATGPTALWATTEVTMDGADVTVSLTLQPAMSAKGRVAFEGASAPPKNSSALRVVLIPPGAGGSLSSGPPGGQVSADGTFTFSNVTPGPYRIAVIGSVSGEGWRLKSATGNGRDAWDAWLQVGPGENLDIVVTYTDRPTEIAGTLRDDKGQPVPEHFIVVFPADKSLWIAGSKRMGSVRPGTDGQFSMSGLPPGDYLLVALTDVEPGEWNDRAFLETLAPNGIKISLADGEKKRQDLQIRN